MECFVVKMIPSTYMTDICIIHISKSSSASLQIPKFMDWGHTNAKQIFLQS